MSEIEAAVIVFGFIAVLMFLLVIVGLAMGERL